MYKVVVPETDVKGNTPASTSANICVSTSVPNPLFTAVSNISATGGSSVVSRTKQSTLLLEGNVLKLGPKLNVSCQLMHSLNNWASSSLSHNFLLPLYMSGSEKLSPLTWHCITGQECSAAQLTRIRNLPATWRKFTGKFR